MVESRGGMERERWRGRDGEMERERWRRRDGQGEKGGREAIKEIWEWNERK